MNRLRDSLADVVPLVRPHGGEERSTRRGLWRRLRLRRGDGVVYLNRWGFAHERVGRVLVHRMDGPDPGRDLHDHPWWFVSIILWGGYDEHRANVREAIDLARIAERNPMTCTAGVPERRRWLSARTMRLDECHTITNLHRGSSWSLVIGGPRRRRWGFYVPAGFVDEADYAKLGKRSLAADRAVNTHSASTST